MATINYVQHDGRWYVKKYDADVLAEARALLSALIMYQSKPKAAKPSVVTDRWLYNASMWEACEEKNRRDTVTKAIQSIGRIAEEPMYKRRVRRQAKRILLSLGITVSKYAHADEIKYVPKAIQDLKKQIEQETRWQPTREGTLTS